MHRREFLSQSIHRGIVAGAGALLFPGCASYAFQQVPFEKNFSGKVIIIGAGSAGLTVAYLLNQYGVEFTLLEASSRFGGRVKKLDGFADFPIDLGAEWIHTDPEIFARLLKKPGFDYSDELIEYDPERIFSWVNNELVDRSILASYFSEYKFESTTWYDFFDRHVVPEVGDKIIYESPVVAIDYSFDTIIVRNSQQQTFEADKVIVAVPLTALKNDTIQFTPALPSQKRQALNAVDMPAGLKVFMRFSERFYPDAIMDGGIAEDLRRAGIERGEKLIYDAALRKESSMNVLALFAVGEPAVAYTQLASDDEIAQAFLDELDAMFNGKASRYYQSHVVQNWTREPWILGSYSHYQDYDAKHDLAHNIADKVYFAGEALADDDALGTVHGAGQSAHRVVRELLA